MFVVSTVTFVCVNRVAIEDETVDKNNKEELEEHAPKCQGQKGVECVQRQERACSPCTVHGC